MGREARATQLSDKLDSAQFERVVGPLQDFMPLPVQCPKCGATQNAIVFCPGKDMTGRYTEKESCFCAGQHLHVDCGACGAPRIFRCMDDAENADQIELQARVNPEMVRAFLAILKAHTKEPGAMNFSDVVLEAQRGEAVAMKRADGLVRFELVPKEGA